MSVAGRGRGRRGVAEGEGWRRGMTNPGRWLDCQWQVNIDVEEVFFTFSAFLFLRFWHG